MLQFLTGKSSKSPKASKNSRSRSTTRRRHVASGLLRCAGGERSRSCTPERTARTSCRLPSEFTQLSPEEFLNSFSPIKESSSKFSFTSRFRKKTKAEKQRQTSEQQRKKFLLLQQREVLLRQFQESEKQKRHVQELTTSSEVTQQQVNEKETIKPFEVEKPSNDERDESWDDVTCIGSTLNGIDDFSNGSATTTYYSQMPANVNKSSTPRLINSTDYTISARCLNNSSNHEPPPVRTTCNENILRHKPTQSNGSIVLDAENYFLKQPSNYSLNHSFPSTTPPQQHEQDSLPSFILPLRTGSLFEHFDNESPLPTRSISLHNRSHVFPPFYSHPVTPSNQQNPIFEEMTQMFYTPSCKRQLVYNGITTEENCNQNCNFGYIPGLEYRLRNLQINHLQSSMNDRIYSRTRRSPRQECKSSGSRRPSGLNIGANSCNCHPVTYSPSHVSTPDNSTRNSSETRLADDSGVCSVSDDDRQTISPALRARDNRITYAHPSPELNFLAPQTRRLLETVKRSRSSPCGPPSQHTAKTPLIKVLRFDPFIRSSWVTDMVLVSRNNADFIVAVDTEKAFVLESSGSVVGTIGGRLHGNHALVQPTSLATCGDDHVAFNDRGQRNIKIFSLDDRLLTIIENQHFTNIAGMSSNPDGDLFIASTDSRCIFVLRSNFPNTIECFPHQQQRHNSIFRHKAIFDHPYCLAVSKTSGDVIVGDDERHLVVAADVSGGDVLWRFSPSGVKEGNFLPSCICTDWRGWVFIGDSCNGKVYLLDPCGRYSKTLLTRTSGLNGAPTAMCTDSVGRLFVSDDQSTIKVFRYLDEGSL